MYNLTKYSDNYSKTSGILWQYCRDEANATTDSFSLKEKLTGQTGKNGTKMLK